MKGQTLAIKEFRYYLSARFLVTIALQMQAVIIGFEIYRITKDVMALGYIGLAEAIPALSLALFGGHAADKYNRKHILVATYGALVFAFGVLCALAHPVFELSDSLQYVNIMYGVIFFTGIVRAFIAPAQFSLIPLMVPRDKLPNASAWNSSSWQTAAIIGPAVGGILYAQSGMFWSMIYVVALLLLGWLAIMGLKSHPVERSGHSEPIMERLSSGVKYVFSNKIILGALSLDMFSVLFGGAVALLPAFADEVFHLGVEELGYLRAAPNAGSAIMLMLLAFKKSYRAPGVLLLRCVAGFGLCMIFFALTSNYYLALILLFLSGVFDSVSVMVRSVILQLQTPDHMRGRVAAVNSMFIGSSNELGALESGVAARLLGLVPSVLFGGVMVLAVVTVAYIKGKELREFKF